MAQTKAVLQFNLNLKTVHSKEVLLRNSYLRLAKEKERKKHSKLVVDFLKSLIYTEHPSNAMRDVSIGTNREQRP